MFNRIEWMSNVMDLALKWPIEMFIYGMSYKWICLANEMIDKSRI